MAVPLLARSVRGADDRERLDAWFPGGTRAALTPDTYPYLYASEPAVASAPLVNVRLLSSLQPAQLYFNRFPNEMRRAWFAKNVRAHGGTVAEAEVRYLDRVVADEPDFLRNATALHATRAQPRCLYLDIEQITDGKTFPAKEAPVISIAWAVDNGPVECLAIEPGAPDVAIQSAVLVSDFLARFRKADPDLVIGFNHELYDLTVLVHHLGPSATSLTRDGSMPTFEVKPDKTGRDRVRCHLEGRVVWDVHPATEIDMELSGCEDRKLKTIARFLKLDNVVSVDDYNTRALPRAKLLEYNVSDVRLLREIARRYLADRLYLAEFVGCPYDSILNGGSAKASSYFAIRADRNAGVVSDGTNEARYDWCIPRSPKPPFNPLAFEGATVGIEKTGRFAPLYKSDFASLYPTLIDALGIGPDNTVVFDCIEGVAEDAPPLQLAQVSGDVRRYAIADRVLNRTFLVRVMGRSRFADDVADLMRQRLALKKQAKAATGAEKVNLEARAYAMKVVVNSAFGYQGADYAPHGSKAVAMMITAGGRAMLEELSRAIGAEYVVEIDTDGVYFDGTPPTREALRATVNLAAAGRYGMQPVFDLDLDSYDAGYFYKSKSYLLLDGDKITAHGVAFKGSTHPGFFRRIVAEVGRAVLQGGDVTAAARAARDLGRYERGDFVKRVRWDGKEKAHVGRQVAESFAKLHGRAPAATERMKYLKTTEGYEVDTPEAFTRLDRAYYQAVADEAIERLGALTPAVLGQVSLSDWR